MYTQMKNKTKINNLYTEMKNRTIINDLYTKACDAFGSRWHFQQVINNKSINLYLIADWLAQ